jgi:molybdopterin molybdotransferase
MALTTYDAALARLRAEAADVALGSESVALAQAAGRVLAEAVVAPFAVPGFANAAMDGYALRAGVGGVRAGQRFRCLGLALAGADVAAAVEAGCCREIATGAMLPDGADTVVQYEHTDRDGEVVTVRVDTAQGASVRAADEDYAAGQAALPAGRVLDAGALGVLASFGRSSVPVRRRPRIALIVTGSELVAAGQARAPGQIHDSNSTTLRVLLGAHAGQLSVFAPVVDERERLRALIAVSAAEHDVVITAGGASAGRADFIPELVRELGEIRLWKVATRPGMPFLYGRIGTSTVYGLPGNPVSVVASLLSLVLPALDVMQGRAAPAPEFAALTRALKKSHARLEWRRGWLATSRDGRRELTPHAAQGSGMLRGVAESNALFRIDPETRALGAGALVEVLPFPA